MRKKAYFLTLEGIEGAGKSTCSQIIYQHLVDNAYPALITREPGGTVLGEAVRALLLKSHDAKTPETPICVEVELCLLFSARIQHMQTRIAPALASGISVICDRYVDASYAYQGGGRGLSDDRIYALERWASLPYQPDFTLLLDLPVELAMLRLKQRQTGLDRFEQEPYDFFRRVREKYLQRAALASDRFKIIDASQTLDQVTADLKRVLQECITPTF